MKCKALFLILCVTQYLLGSTEAFAQKNCNHTIQSTDLVIDGSVFEPGDTVCLAPGNRSYLYFTGIVGTAEQPVVIVNQGRVTIDTDHYFGIKFSGCRYVVLIGNGSSSDQYGIKIKRVGNGAGITIDDLSSDIEVAYTEISFTAIGGIYAKTDPDCTFAATRDKFTMYNLKIHHCYLHDIQDEGMYIGSSKYTGQHLSDCDTTVLPHLLNGVRIYNNVVDRTGWDGIQVSSSPTDCKIYNNLILNDSYRATPNQMSGILIGGGSNCDCYNNSIYDGKGDGIDVFGFGTMRIFNNLIVRAGNNYFPGDLNYPRHAIFVGNAPDSANANLKITYNTIIKPKTNGIRYFNRFTQQNLFANNIIAEPLALETYGNQSYINHQLEQSLFSQQNNLMASHAGTVGFLNPNDDNYDLRPDSPAVNQAAPLGPNDIAFDILQRGRPFHQQSDQGAYECQDPYANIEANSTVTNQLFIYPNPVTENLIFRMKNDGNEKLTVHISDLSGKLLLLEKLQTHAGENTHLTLDSNLFKNGMYFLSVQTKSGTYISKFIYLK